MTSSSTMTGSNLNIILCGMRCKTQNDTLWNERWSWVMIHGDVHIMTCEQERERQFRAVMERQLSQCGRWDEIFAVISCCSWAGSTASVAILLTSIVCRLVPDRGAATFFKVGGSNSLVTVLLPFYGKKLVKSTQLGAVGYIITLYS